MARKRYENTTRMEIIHVGVQLMLEKGFTATTIKEISEILEISKGNITFYFPTKEHLLLEFAKEVVRFHTQSIDEVQEGGYGNLLAYCWEIVAQIAVCENDEKMKDLYLALYSHPQTLSLIKDWTAEKNYKLLHEYVPDWTVEGFRIVENVACCIERSALTEACTETYTFETKVRLTLGSLLRLYDIDPKEREKVIDQITKMDYKQVGQTLQKEFVKYVEETNQIELR